MRNFITLLKKMEDALVEWLNTFELDRSCDSMNDIVDGVILVKVMSQVFRLSFVILCHYRPNETSSRARRSRRSISMRKR